MSSLGLAGQNTIGLLIVQAYAVLQVTKITPRLVATDILCVGNRPLSDEKFTGIIRYSGTMPYLPSNNAC